MGINLEDLCGIARHADVISKEERVKSANIISIIYQLQEYLIRECGLRDENPCIRWRSCYSKDADLVFLLATSYDDLGKLDPSRLGELARLEQCLSLPRHCKWYIESVTNGLTREDWPWNPAQLHDLETVEEVNMGRE
ncbi:hypothetical protein Moror_8794 [Moniliophthora roreri MCA 2997]|nr:hypothetical protein Moror_8794 [Moniliophthora roreri MCA 2997]